jgi:hypothetical protein
MNIRDRIKELRRVKASELRPSPKNWRTHPQAQQDALRGVLAEIGIVETDYHGRAKQVRLSPPQQHRKSKR